MSRVLAAPQSVVNFIDGPIFSSSFRTTSVFALGALGYVLLSSLISQRLTTFLAIAVLLIRLVPTLLVATGRLPNPELSKVVPGKTAVLFPQDDGSTKPGNGKLAVLHLGLKISHPLGYFAPGVKQTGDYFNSLVKELNDNRTAHGWLGGSLVQGVPDSPSDMGHLSIIGYFKSMDDLHRYAHGDSHREAWNWWNKNLSKMPHLGVYHEVFDVPAHHFEAIYSQTPKLGLGMSKVEVKAGEWKSVLADARKGALRSSSGRMGRGEGKTYDDDPYLNE